MDADMAAFYARRVIWMSSFVGNLKPLDNELGLSHVVCHTNRCIK